MTQQVQPREERAGAGGDAGATITLALSFHLGRGLAQRA
jgi:hypothetical protein